METIKKGQKINNKFLIVDIEEKDTRTGKKYLNMVLSDGERYINAKKWNARKLKRENKKYYKKLIGEKGLVALIHGKGDVYKGKEQIIIDTIDILENEDQKDYLPTSDRNFEDMKDEFNMLLETIKDKEISKLLNKIFDEKMKKKFFEAPASMSFHHDYIRGLLEHTLQISKLANKVIEVYGNIIINRDILLAGVLLHDIGKVIEYYNDVGNIDKTDEGKLVGHIVIGSEFVDRYSREIQIDYDKVLKIKHIILSHHGQREFGAAVLPQTPEAFLVHMLDNVDAKMRKFNDIFINMDDDSRWSNYERMFNSEIFLG